MLKCAAFLVEFVDEKIQNTREYYIQKQFAMYAVKVQRTLKKVTTKTIIVSGNAYVVNVKRLMMRLRLKYNPLKLMGNIGGSVVKTSNEKSEGKGGKQQNFHRLLNSLPKKGKSEYHTQRKRQDLLHASFYKVS